MADGGYDVADYRDVDPLFGTLADFDALVAEAHAPRHPGRSSTSCPTTARDEHAWFQAALAAGPGSPERARYLFRAGRGPARRRSRPTTGESIFGGPAWTRVAGRRVVPAPVRPRAARPQLDNPEVVDEFEDILRFWLDRGVDGFRIDVAHGLVKEPGLPDVGRRPRRRWRRRPGPRADRRCSTSPGCTRSTGAGARSLDAYDGDRMPSARCGSSTAERLARYVAARRAAPGVQLRLLRAAGTPTTCTTAIDTSLAEAAARRRPRHLGAVQPRRHAARHPLRRRRASALARARAAALLMLALPGSAYVYQGEELGLPEVARPARRGPARTRSGTARGTPSAAATAAGCRSPGPAARSRTGSARPAATRGCRPAGGPGPPLSVEAQAGDPGSTLSLYRAALRLRRTAIPRGEPFDWVEGLPDGVLAFRRGRFLCVVNVGDEPFTPPVGLVAGAELLLASDPTYADASSTLPGRHDRLGTPDPLTPHPSSRDHAHLLPLRTRCRPGQGSICA